MTVRPCEFAGGRHDFRRPIGDGTFECSAPGCYAVGVPVHRRLELPTIAGLDLLGRELAVEVDRLWPDEQNPAYRGQCLAEEAGEVNRAITKRRHAARAHNGLCKGKTVDEWTAELELELAQLVGVAADIAYREGIDLAGALVRCLEVLRDREAGS